MQSFPLLPSATFWTQWL